MIDPNANNKVVEITKQFSYDMPDAYLYQTANEGNVGTWTYEGPKELWVFLRKRDNKRTGQTRFAYEVEDNYMPNAGDYMVKINCEEDPLLCELMETDQDTLFLEGREMVSETLPVNDWEGNPFVHIEPKVPTPDHTYDRDQIEYNPVSQEWVRPFPFVKPHTNWEEIKKVRWSKLNAADGHVSEDMPSSLLTAWTDYRTALREIPATYGAAWTVAIATAGSGYAVGDNFNVDASVFGLTAADVGKLDDLSQPMGTRPGFDFEAATSGMDDTAIVSENDSLDVNIIVTAVSGSGAVTAVRTRNAFNARHIKEARTLNAVATTATTDAGSGAVFNLAKVVRIDPWKVRFPQSPNAQRTGVYGERDQFPGAIGRYLTDEARNDPADGWLMEHTYHPSTGHFVPPESGGNYFAADLARLNLSTDGTSFDDGIVDGLSAAPNDALGNPRIAGTITARKQS